MEPSPQINGKFTIRINRHETEEGIHRSITDCNPFIFIGLYLIGKREKTEAVPGITLALSMNRELIWLHQQSQIPSDERKRE
jgi:hypothetical protein